MSRPGCNDISSDRAHSERCTKKLWIRRFSMIVCRFSIFQRNNVNRTNTANLTNKIRLFAWIPTHRAFSSFASFVSFELFAFLFFVSILSLSPLYTLHENGSALHAMYIVHVLPERNTVQSAIPSLPLLLEGK